MESIEQIGNSFEQTSAQIRKFVAEIESYYMLERSRPQGIERREVERINVTMPVQITRLDEQFVPLSYQYHAITRDVSAKGVGMVSSNPIGLNFILMTFQPYYGEAYNAIAKVNRCEEIGYYFSIGCEFLVTQ